MSKMPRLFFMNYVIARDTWMLNLINIKLLKLSIWLNLEYIQYIEYISEFYYIMKIYLGKGKIL